MHDRVADLSTLKATGKAVPLEGWDLINSSTDCLGGGGDSKLLKEKSYEELFRPQLSESSKQAIASAAGK